MAKVTDRHVIELLTLLDQAGWIRSDVNGGGKKLRTLEPYTIGGKKVWYLHAAATTFNAAYFQCLLQAIGFAWKLYGIVK